MADKKSSKRKTDLLLPPQIEKRWAEKVRPMLETLGVPGSTPLTKILGDAAQARLWALSVRRPKAGSVVVPQKLGTNYRSGDVVVRFEEGGQRSSKDDPVVIQSVYGVSSTARAAEEGADRHAEWEVVTLLAVTNDFVTLVAEILPGKDVFAAVELWVNAAMPVFALAQRPSEFSGQCTLRNFRNLDSGDVELITVCKECCSTGKISCKKCGGGGTWKPDGRCGKCSGTGDVECKRCGGTGDFIGKYGDVMGDCNSCGGTGERTCPACDGTGEPPVLECKACGGTGKWDCRPCQGTGALRVQLHTGTGIYWCGRSMVKAGDVGTWEVSANQEYDPGQSAADILEELEAQAQAVRHREEQILAVQKEIEPIENCLNLAMQAQESPSELFNFRPVKLGKPESTTHRTKGRQILGFGMPKPPAWAREGQLPFDQNTPLKFSIDQSGREPVELMRQHQNGISKPVDSFLHGIEDHVGKPRLLVSFPSDLVSGCIPAECYLRPDVIPPAELAQQKELAKWCAKSKAIPQLAVLATPTQSGKLKKGPKTVKTGNKAIVGNPRQQEALNWILSDAPVVLVKGPPGTGKTTVITEAVLQCIARGQKILVCSETHQAVANVLERLDKDGRIRMLRHARHDSTRITDLERDYLEGGSRQSFLREVRERSREQVKNLKHRLELLNSLLACLPAALDASEQLRQSRDESAKTILDAEQQFAAQIAAIEAEKRDSCKQIERHYADETKELKMQQSAATTRQRLLLQSKAGSEKDKAAARIAYRKKTGREPEPSVTGWSPWYTFPWLKPNALASVKLLNERFVKASSDLDQTNKALLDQEKLIEELKGKLSQAEIEREKALDFAASKAQDSKSFASSELDGRKDTAMSKLHGDEARLLPPQNVAAQAWNAVSGFETVSPDLTSPEWNQMTGRAGNETEHVRILYDFCHRWHDAMDSAQTTLSKLFWETTDVFLSTCVGLASWRSFAEYFGKDGVDVVIIDEAAHVTLTQTMIPMSRAKRAILIGDEMQLPPAPPMELAGQCGETCKARCTPVQAEGHHHGLKPVMSSCWLERSAFEWIGETRPWIPKIMLTKQFRMHPDIADFVADVFYEGKLENGVSTRDRELCFGVFTKAVCLIPTSAYKDRFERMPAGATSYQSPLEVEMTRRVLEQAKRHLTKPTSVGVVTPYAAQKDLMRRELASFFSTEGNLRFQPEDIASVDSFQGSERDVMIASFVRSPRKEPQKCRKCDGTGKLETIFCDECGGSGWKGSKLNWVHDLRRLNVAFSRAKKMLILIGDIKTLTDRRYGTPTGVQVLERFDSHVRNRGKVLHVWEEPRHE